MLPTETVSTEDAELPEDRVRLVGLSESVGPLGDTAVPSETVPANPFRLVSVTVDVVVEPWVMETDDGDVEMVKSGVDVVVWKNPCMLLALPSLDATRVGRFQLSSTVRSGL